MSVCPNILVLRFYGCCHPCYFYFGVKSCNPCIAYNALKCSGMQSLYGPLLVIVKRSSQILPEYL